MFKLELRDREGKNHYLFYDPHKSLITDEDGNDIVSNIKETQQYNTVKAISPENHGKKSKNIKTLKIQLGLACNYSCSYCSQKEEIKFGSKTNIRDAEIFMSNLDKWLVGEPNRIEFWGGEPLLYWKKIKFLVEKLSEKYPKTEFLIISNGSLLTDEIIEYIEKYDIIFVISHDGPGQHVRGPDPFDDENQFNMIKKLYNVRKNKDKMCFNAILSPVNYDIEKIISFFKNKIDEDVNVNLEGVFISHEGNDQYFTQEQYSQLTNNVALASMKPRKELMGCFNHAINDFIKSIVTKRPSDSLGLHCGMDSEDKISVDLLGNVMTCQNTGALGKHRIGNIQDFDNIKLNTSWHWKYRDECSECPVLQICQGSCMYMEGKNWYHTCNNYYHYNIGILGGALYHMTGMVLTGVYGKIRRPNPEQYGIEDTSK